MGFNYQAHAAETGTPIPKAPPIFSKFANALNHHDGVIELPTMIGKEFDYETELVIVFGRKCKNVSKENALSVVAGYAVGNDFSARGLQNITTQFTAGKMSDGFAPLGPWLVTRDRVPEPNNLRLKTWVNGEIRQDSSTSEMIFDCREIIRYVASIMTIEPGDILFTGTPPGVIWGQKVPRDERQWLKAGDKVVSTPPSRSAIEQRLREPPQSADAVFDAMVPGMPGAQPEAIAKAPACGEDVTGREANALFERFVEERARVKAPRQFQPEHEAACWPAYFRVGREACLDRTRHAPEVLFEDAPHAAQVCIVCAALQKVRERDLRQNRAAEAERQFAFHHLLRIGARHNPADPIPGCKAFRKRAAVDRIGAAVECDKRLGPLATEVDVPVDVVFDQRHGMPREQRKERALVGFGHRAA